MNFMVREPLRSRFETEEEYERELWLYEAAMDDYCDEYIEMRQAER